MDINSIAKSIVDQATGEKPIERPKSKSPQAIARGKARAAKLPSGKASEIAKIAANKRWGK